MKDCKVASTRKPITNFIVSAPCDQTSNYSAKTSKKIISQSHVPSANHSGTTAVPVQIMLTPWSNSSVFS